MKTVLVGCLAVAALALGGCEQQKHQSIEAMNRGVQAFNSGAAKKAVAELEQAIALDPENHFAAWNLALVHLKQKEWENMVDVLQTAVKYGEDEPMYHYQLGHAYMELGKWDMAEQALGRAVELNDRLYKAQWMLGKVHLAQDRPKEAAMAWSEAARLNPNFGKPFTDLGKLYYQWDFFDEAQKVLVQGAQYARDAEDLTDIYYYLGLSRSALKQTDGALEAYAQAVDARADNVQAKLQLAMAYADKGDDEKALELLEDFVKTGGGGDAFALQAANDRIMRIKRGQYEEEAARAGDPPG